MRDDTIAAIATAPGRAAIAVVRLSGPKADGIARRIVTPWPSEPRMTARCRFHEPDRPTALIDEGLAVVFPAPRSYTGETVVELHTHGGTFVPQAVLAAAIVAGAREATPGEFTARAVLNGKLDLVGAEAVGDLIDARTRAAHRIALHQLSGALSARFGALREGILELEALLAYDIDFPDEDPGMLPRARIDSAGRALVADLDELLATAPAAILGREGATVVFAGPPNAGKSSLLNALIGESRVIVSPEPGTTRDAVEVLLEQDPWPLRLVDTAGLRDDAGAVERQGIEMAERYIASAHVVIACGESEGALRRGAAAARARSGATVVGALTKRDLTSASAPVPVIEGVEVVSVSAIRGDGLGELLSCVNRAVRAMAGDGSADAPVVARARQRAALERARAELTAFLEAWTTASLPAPVAATHVRAAAHALDELIGAVDVDDVFARVFSTFCIGK